MYDDRTNLGQQVARDVREFFKEKVYTTVIPRNVRLGEAPSHGKPVVLYDAKSRGAEAYLALAREVLATTARSRSCKVRSDVATAMIAQARTDDGETTSARQRPERADSRRAAAGRSHRPGRDRRRSPRAERLPAAHDDGHGATRRAGRVDPRQRRDSADRRSQDRRRLSHHRRRTPLARGTEGRSHARARRRERGDRSRRAGPSAADGPHREHPARRPQRDRGGESLSAPRRRVLAHAGRDRRGRRQGSRDDRQHAAPAEAARRVAERSSPPAP